MNRLHNQIHTFYIKWNKKILLTLGFATVLCVYFYNLMAIGPEYDELLSINAALNCPSNMFLERIFWIEQQCIPLMLSPYIGGLTASVYKVFFIFVPSSVLTFRLINIAMFFLAVFLLFISIKKITTTKVGLYSVFLLFFDFQLWYNIRIDRPSAIPFLIKSLFIFLLVNYLKDKKKIYLLLAGLAMGLSIWTKFDSFFFYISIVLSFILYYWKKITLQKIILFLSGTFIGIIPFILYLIISTNRFFIVSLQIGKSNFIERIFEKVPLLFYQFSSYDAIWYIFRQEKKVPLLIFLSTIALWTIFVIALKSLWKTKSNQFLISSLCIFFLCFLFYGGMISAHHRFLIYPIPHFLLARYLVAKGPIIKLGFLFVYIFIFLHSYLYIHNQTHEIGSIGAFTKQVYQLSDYLNKIDTEILVGDWGIATQLVFLSNNPENIYEISYATNTKNTIEIDLETLEKIQNCKYILLHKKNQVIFKNSDANLRSLIRGSLVYTDPVYELWKCKETK